MLMLADGNCAPRTDSPQRYMIGGKTQHARLASSTRKYFIIESTHTTHSLRVAASLHRLAHRPMTVEFITHSVFTAQGVETARWALLSAFPDVRTAALTHCLRLQSWMSTHRMHLFDELTLEQL